MKRWFNDTPIVKKITWIYLVAILLPTVIFNILLFKRTLSEENNKQKAGTQALLHTVVQNIEAKGAMVESGLKLLANDEEIISFLRGEKSQVKQIMKQKNEVTNRIGQVQAYLSSLGAEITLYATNEEIPIVWWKILAVEDTQNTKDFKLFKETKKDFFWVGVHDFYSAHKKWHRGRDIPMFIAFTSIIRGIDETLGYIKGGVDPSKIFSSIDEWVGDGEIYITQGEKIIYDKRIKKQGEKIKKDKEITISEYSSLMNLNFSVSLNSAAIYAQGVKSALPLFVLLLAASFLLLVAIRAILKTILGRLEQAVYYTNKVEAGDSEVVFPESGGDEVGQLISSMNLLLDKLRKNAQEKILYEKSEKKALILALQYQVNPHFLFNTLNWLQLSFEMGAEKENLSKAISMLSQLLRYNLSGDPLGSIEEEVANVKTYVALMNMRKNHTILIHIDLSSIEEEIAVMRFMFQPLVENAIQHGLVKTKPLNVYITGKQVGNQITFYVKNDGFPISTKGLEILEENKEKRKEGKGIGLANIAARLKFLYGEKSSLAITSNEKETVIEISFSIL